MNSYLSKIGYQGPNILTGVILVSLITTTQYANVYLYIYVIVWQIISHLLNITIKNTLKHPRPDSDKNENFKNLKPCIDNYLTIHRNFGMPSGHAQAVISQLVFIALYFQQPSLTTVSIIQAGLTLWQRYATHRHSIKQLIAGSMIGVIVGVSFYKIIPFITENYKLSSASAPALASASASTSAPAPAPALAEFLELT